MRYVCDAPNRQTWFRIDAEFEAEEESRLMRHAVEKYFKREETSARASYRSPSPAGIERDIGLKAHIARKMPRFLTLRTDDGTALATAMLPAEDGSDAGFRIIVVGPDNADPYERHADAIAALAHHVGLGLPRERCYPYADRR